LKPDKNHCLSGDIQRSVNFWKSKNENVIMVVVAMTWYDHILKWWMMNEKTKTPTANHKSNEWRRLKKQFEDHEIYPGHMPLPNYGEKDFFHAVFYGIFNINT
jgi:hypothetical protein